MKSPTPPVTETIAHGGRKGSVKTSRKGFNLTFKPTTRANPQGLTPEHLFGGAWAACFCGAVMYVAKESGHSDAGIMVTAKVQQRQKGSQPFAVELIVRIPDLDERQAKVIVQKAHALCAYSRATKGNVAVKLTILANPKKQTTPKTKTKQKAKSARRSASAQRRSVKAKAKVKSVAKTKKPIRRAPRLKTPKPVEPKQPAPAVHAPQPPMPSHDEIIREQQKRIARAPQFAATSGFRPKPAPSGKPLWSRPHSA